MSAATRAAEAWLISRNADIKAFEAINLMLLKVVSPAAASAGVCARVECWYYRLVFDPVVGGRRLAGSGGFTAIVLMDGSVVEPRTDTAPGTTVGPGSGTGGGRGLGIPGSGGGPPSSGQNSATGTGTATVYRPGNDVTLPKVVREVKPQYTSEAMRAKISGTVTVEAVVKTDGTVGDVKVVRSLDKVLGLDEQAIKAVRQWRFSPGTRLGQPVPVVVMIELQFYIK